MKPRTDPGCGYVTLPSWLIGHPDLKDRDARMLLALDQLGHREGPRDGLVRAPNSEIAARLGWGASSVKASLDRLRRFDPPLVGLREPIDDDRDAIRLLYDRYGVLPNMRATPTLSVVTAEGGVARDATTPGAIVTTPTPNATIVASRGGVAHHATGSDYAGVAHHATTLPIREIDQQQHLSGGPIRGGVAHHATTPDLAGSTAKADATIPDVPRTMAALIAWLPAITDDAELLARLRKRVPQWLARLKANLPELADALLVEWVQDALLAGDAAADLVPFADAILKDWVNLKGRPRVELARTVLPARPMPDETDQGVPVARAAPRRDKVSAFLEGQDAAIKARRARKDAEDAQGA